jgi:hypothetical protein
MPAQIRPISREQAWQAALCLARLKHQNKTLVRAGIKRRDPRRTSVIDNMGRYLHALSSCNDRSFLVRKAERELEAERERERELRRMAIGELVCATNSLLQADNLEQAMKNIRLSDPVVNAYWTEFLEATTGHDQGRLLSSLAQMLDKVKDDFMHHDLPRLPHYKYPF